MIDIKLSIFIGIFAGGLMILLGLLFTRKPCEYKSGNGFRTPHALKSRENWDFAQKNGPKVFIRFGTASILLSVLGIILLTLCGQNSNVCFAFSILVSAVSFGAALIIVDRMTARFEKE